MTRIIGGTLAVSLVVLLTVQGCSDDNSDPAAAPGKSTVATDASSPDEAVRRVLAGIREGKAGVMWDALPPSYQADLNQIVRDFAAKMDEEVWRRTFETLQRVVRVAREKESFLLDNPDIDMGRLDTRQLAANWPELMNLFGTLVNGELADLEKLRNFDGATFLKGTGTEFLMQLAALSAKDPNDPFKKRLTTQVRLAEVTGDRAIVEFIAANDQAAQFLLPSLGAGESQRTTFQGVFLLVEGKWLPDTFAGPLKQAIDDGMQQVADLPPDAISQHRERMLKLLDEINTALDAIEEAKSTADFNKAFADAQVRLIELVAAPGEATATGGGNSPAPAANRVRGITVVITGEIDETTLRNALAVLQTAGDSEAVPDYVRSDDATTITFRSSRAVTDIAGAVNFGTVKRVDTVNLIVIVSLNKSPDKKQPATKKPAAKKPAAKKPAAKKPAAKKPAAKKPAAKKPGDKTPSG